jgi:hypothetical protein
VSRATSIETGFRDYDDVAHLFTCCTNPENPSRAKRQYYFAFCAYPKSPEFAKTARYNSMNARDGRGLTGIVERSAME